MIKKIKDLYKKYEEIINYLIIGGLTTVIGLVSYYACVYTFLNPNNAIELQIANIISWICAVTFAYITNRIWVFESKSKNIIYEMVKFFGARLVTLGMEMLIMYIFVTALGLNSDMWVVIWTLVTQVLIVIGNYILSKLFVFKNKKK